MADYPVGPVTGISPNWHAQDRVERFEPDRNAAAPTASAPPAQPDDVSLSSAARNVMRSNAVDEARLAQIRQAIETGNYPLDSRRIAESFVALEQLIAGTR